MEVPLTELEESLKPCSEWVGYYKMESIKKRLKQRGGNEAH